MSLKLAVGRRRTCWSFLQVFTGWRVALAQISTQYSPSVPRYVSPYGGVNEFGAWGGYSPVSGGLYGYDENVRYLSLDVRYSLLIRGGPNVNLRFAPEVTALADLMELKPSLTNPAAPVSTLGSGLSPQGFQLLWRSST